MSQAPVLVRKRRGSPPSTSEPLARVFSRGISKFLFGRLRLVGGVTVRTSGLSDKVGSGNHHPEESATLHWLVVHDSLLLVHFHPQAELALSAAFVPVSKHPLYAGAREVRSLRSNDARLAHLQDKLITLLKL